MRQLLLVLVLLLVLHALLAVGWLLSQQRGLAGVYSSALLTPAEDDRGKILPPADQLGKMLRRR